MEKSDLHRFAHARLCKWGENRAHDLEGLGWPATGQLEQMRLRAQGGGADTSGEGLTLLEGQTEVRSRTLSVERLVEDLPAAQRIAVTLRYLKGQKPRQIAEATQVTADTARDRLDRAVLAVGRGLFAMRIAKPAEKTA